jgi:hypothetical protein
MTGRIGIWIMLFTNLGLSQKGILIFINIQLEVLPHYTLVVVGVAHLCLVAQIMNFDLKTLYG